MKKNYTLGLLLEQAYKSESSRRRNLNIEIETASLRAVLANWGKGPHGDLPHVPSRTKSACNG